MFFYVNSKVNRTNLVQLTKKTLLLSDSHDIIAIYFNWTLINLYIVLIGFVDN